MYVRLNRYKDIDWGMLQSSLGWFQEVGIPDFERTPGYKGTFFGVNEEQGKAAGVTFWDSLGALTDSELVEKRLRDEATMRAGTDVGEGILERYELALRMPGDAERVHARLIRWAGLTDERLRDGHQLFAQELAPQLQEEDGFAGGFTAINPASKGLAPRKGETPGGKGLVLGVFMWDSVESMRAAAGWERQTRARLEETTGPQRRMIADDYQVAIVAEPGLTLAESAHAGR